MSFSSFSFTSTGQSIFSCCWWSQVRPCAAAINAPCPTGDYRHHRVSQQPSIAKKTSPSTTENVSQSLQNPTRKKRNWRKNQWGTSTWCLPSQPLLAAACACAPVNKTDHQCWTATHVDAVSSTRPHELRVISQFSVVLDAKLAHAQWPPSRSRVPTNAPIEQYKKKKGICSISSRSRVLAHRPCPKLEMFCPSVLQLFFLRLQQSSYDQSQHEFENRLEIRPQLP